MKTYLGTNSAALIDPPKVSENYKRYKNAPIDDPIHTEAPQSGSAPKTVVLLVLRRIVQLH